MDRSKKVIGVLLIVLSIAALITWEKWGKERLLYDEILVLNASVPKGMIIEKEMVVKTRSDTKEIDCLKVGEIKEIIGKEAVSYVHKGVPLFREYFERKELAPSEGNMQYVLCLTADWIESIPQSIKRGCRTYLYAGGKFITSAMVTLVDEEAGIVEVITNDKQTETINKVIENGYKLVLTYN